MQVEEWVRTRGLSRRRASWLVSTSRSQLAYTSRRTEDAKVMGAILKAKEKHPRYGVPRLTVLLRRQGFLVNRKKVYRLCKLLGVLTLKKKKPQRRVWSPRLEKTPVAVRENHVWSMDFVAGRLKNGKKFRCFTVIDTYTRVSPMILTAQSMKAFLPMRSLDHLKSSQALPKIIVLDNGPEFANGALTSWASENGVQLHFIDPGEPTQNAYIESFNGRFRDECLNQNRFNTLKRAREIIHQWREHYNNERPHSSLDYLTPKEFARIESVRLSSQNQVGK